MKRIGSFCYYCGHLGHETRVCANCLEDSVKGERKEDKARPWLKVEQVGRKMEESKENSNTSNRGGGGSSSGTHKKPKPVSLLQVFSNLSMQENIDRANVGTEKSKGKLTQQDTMEIKKLNDKRNEGISEENIVLRELDDNDILTITCNGKTTEQRVGDMGPRTILGEGEDGNQQAHQETIFGSPVLEEENKLKKLKLKKLARGHTSNKNKISGAKRRSVEEPEDNGWKKMCIDEEKSMHEVEGANPQMALTKP